MKITEIIEGRDYELIYKRMTEKAKQGVLENKREYDGDRTLRDTQVGKRKDKVTKSGIVPVNKIQFAFQRKIVQNAAAFLFGEPVHISRDTSQEEGVEPIEEVDNVVLQKNKIRLDSKLLRLAEVVKSETEAAFLFRIKPKEGNKKAQLKCTLIDSDFGKMMPLFDTFGDMVAFGLQIKEKDDDDEEIEVLYIYLETETQVFKIDGDNLIPLSEQSGVHGFDRIPIVYVDQKETDWKQVETMIDRFEVHNSRFGDTNDYFGQPKFKAVGNIDNVPTKDDTGQVYMMDIIETDSGQIVKSDLDVISWDQSPQSVELESKGLGQMIYDMTNTTNVTLDTIKGIGTLSGLALKLLFLNSYIKSKFDFNIFGPAVNRSINIIKSFLVQQGFENEALYDIDYKVKFQSIIPDDAVELINMLSVSTAGQKILSVKTALENNPFVSNAVKEQMQLDEESTGDLGDSFDVQ